jgi:predicted nuclease of predicted toxin-antitoxin system
MPWVNTSELPDVKLPKSEEKALDNYMRQKRKKPRFYADEDFPARAVEIIRAVGLNVVTAEEAGKRGHPDENQLAEAKRQGRILLSCDRDFLNERRFPIIESSTLVVFDFGTKTEDEIVQALQCLAVIELFPDFFERGVKIDAKTSEWTETHRFQEGVTRRFRNRWHQGELQEWVD